MSDNDNPSHPCIPPSRARWRFWMHILLALVILICGIIIGSGATIYVFSTRFVSALQNFDAFPVRMSERMRARLGLNDEQTGKIRAILEKKCDGYAEYIGGMQAWFDKELQSLEEEIAPILTPKQFTAWKKRTDLVRKFLLAAPHENADPGDTPANTGPQ